MTDRDYLEIILQGWCNDISGHLSNHFYREYKKAKENHYSQTEFFEGLIRHHKALIDWVDNIYYKKLNEFYTLESVWESEGKDVQKLQGQKPQKENYSANIFHITKDPKYIGRNLYLSDVIYIGGQIAEAYIRIQKENGLYCYENFQELFYDAISFGDIPDPITPLKKSIKQSLHKNQFENFLLKVLNLDEVNAPKYLTRKAFKEYLDYFDKTELLKDDAETIKAIDSEINNKPKTFNELFEYTELIQPCIDALKKVSPPIITDKEHFNLGSKSKGSIVAWVSALKAKGIIKNSLSDSLIAGFLNERFKGLELGADGRTLRNISTTAHNNYYTDLLNLLPDLPLSTNGENR